MPGAAPADSSPILPSATELWMPLAGEIGAELEALVAATALKDHLPPAPEPEADFDLMAALDTSGASVPSLADVTASEEAGGAILLEGEELPEPEPGAPTAPVLDTEPPKEGQLKLRCPKCETTGTLPWGRMGSVLCCSGCWTWFRVGTSGNLTEVPPPDGKGPASLRMYSDDGQNRSVRVPKKVLEKSRRSWAARERGHFLRAAFTAFSRRPLAILVVLALVSVTVLVAVRWRPGGPRFLPLPRPLEARARLLAESWLDQDASTVMRLTDPNQDRTMRRWLRDNPSPVPPGRFDRRQIAIEVNILHEDTQTAEVDVRVQLPDGSGPSANVELKQRWSAINGQWYFDPAGQGPQSPPVKAKGAR